MTVSPVGPRSLETTMGRPGDAPPEPSLAGRPRGVLDELVRVLRASAPQALTWASAGEALRVVEAAEAVRAFVDSVSLTATQALTERFQDDDGLMEPGDYTHIGYQQFLSRCRSMAAVEIATATGLSPGHAGRRVSFAIAEEERTRTTRTLMAAGRVSYDRGLALAEETAHLDPAIADAIAGRVLDPPLPTASAHTPGQPPLSQAQFRRRLRRQLVLAEGATALAERTHTAAVDARDARGELNRVGTGTFVLTGDAPRVVAAAERVDRIARRLRHHGDPRTLAQLRSDVGLDLLMHGWFPHPDSPHTTDGTDSTGSTGSTDSSGGPTGAAPGRPWYAGLGAPPVAAVNLTVSLGTILGTEAGAGEIPGWGFLHATQARALALSLGSTWARIVTDPLTGRAIERTLGSYRADTDMARQVHVRDYLCRGPGCTIPATHCDLDHDRPWAPDGTGGATCETNLAAKHRGHHNAKTRRWWTSVQDPDGTITWTTATGRQYQTHPHVYDDPHGQPIDPTTLDAGLDAATLDDAMTPDPCTDPTCDPSCDPSCDPTYDPTVFEGQPVDPVITDHRPDPAKIRSPPPKPVPWKDREAGPPPF